MRDVSCFYGRTIWKYGTLANSFGLVAFLKLHHEEMKVCLHIIWVTTQAASGAVPCPWRARVTVALPTLRGQRLQRGVKKLA